MRLSGARRDRWGSVDENEIVNAIRAAREGGINLFDTAQAYGFGASERLLGRALADDVRNHRDQIVIATKGGLRMQGARLVRRDRAFRSR